MDESILPVEQDRMTSLQVAEIIGKPHNDVLKAIRKMEPAWEKVHGGNFSLVEYTDANGEKRPCYSLTKTEWLYVCTKFNDEARAKLVLRWEELERERLAELERKRLMDDTAFQAQRELLAKTTNIMTASMEFHENDTYTTTQVAARFGMQPWELYDIMMNLRIVTRIKGVGYVLRNRYCWCGKYGRYYNGNKPMPMIVWNQLGVAFITAIIRDIRAGKDPVRTFENIEDDFCELFEREILQMEYSEYEEN